LFSYVHASKSVVYSFSVKVHRYHSSVEQITRSIINITSEGQKLKLLFYYFAGVTDIFKIF